VVTRCWGRWRGEGDGERIANRYKSTAGLHSRITMADNNLLNISVYLIGFWMFPTKRNDKCLR
jgi:hypothetical protein